MNKKVFSRKVKIQIKNITSLLEQLDSTSNPIQTIKQIKLEASLITSLSDIGFLQFDLEISEDIIFAFLYKISMETKKGDSSFFYSKDRQSVNLISWDTYSIIFEETKGSKLYRIFQKTLDPQFEAFLEYKVNKRELTVAKVDPLELRWGKVPKKIKELSKDDTSLNQLRGFLIDQCAQDIATQCSSDKIEKSRRHLISTLTALNTLKKGFGYSYLEKLTQRSTSNLNSIFNIKFSEFFRIEKEKGRAVIYSEPYLALLMDKIEEYSSDN